MTKEECLEALKNIELNYDADYVNECCDEFCMKMKSYITTLEQLIQEHFDNPPLSFDELEKGMWVWDDLNKRYDLIIALDVATAIIPLIEMRESYESYAENRFYRRQKEGYSNA